MGKRKVIADTGENVFKVSDLIIHADLILMVFLQYVSFTDQISRINADTLSSRLSLPGEVYDHETFFYQAVAKWNDLDYGDDYSQFLLFIYIFIVVYVLEAFLDDIPYAELATYAQLLHYQVGFS